MNKKIITTVVVFLASYTTMPAFAFEVDVVEGRADIKTEGGRTTITADTKSVFEGNTDIPQGHVVEIMQGGHDILLRDVTGTQTDWLGSLLSNGNVLLINPHGVFIAQSAAIEVGSLLASTLDVSNEAFMAGGALGFEKIAGMDPARILNEADITLREGGYLVLLAEDIENTGTITAYQGTVAMGVGKKATISFEQDGLVNFVVDEGIDNAIADKGISNQGIIQAEGGRIELTARTMNDTFDQLINNDGEVRASGAVVRDGVVELVSNGGIKSHGSFKTDTLHEEGASFSIGGTFEVGESHHANRDGAITYAADTDVAGVINDIEDIIVNAGVTLTETADTTFNADSDANGTGAFSMGAGASIDGDENDLTINASEDSDVEILSDVGAMGFGSSNGAAVTYDINGSIDTNSDLAIAANVTLDANATSNTVGGSWINSGTFDAGTSTVTFNSTSSETITAGGSSFYNLIFNGVGSTYTQLDDLTITNDFTIFKGGFTSDTDYDFSVGNDFTLGGYEPLNGSVFVVKTIGSDLYVGGSFSNAGGVSSADSIAIWNGNNWSAVGSGIQNGAVWDIEISGGDIYVGGNFTNAGGVGAADRIAYWDGVGWNALGSGIAGWVYAIDIDGSDVYAGGSFTDAGGVSGADNIARWDGVSWNALGGGLNSRVNDIEISGSDVYVGGYFTDAGGVSGADRIARWDGGGWNALGGGLNSGVNDIEISGSDVYVGGYFTDAGGVSGADRIARWDGKSWNSVGDGLNNRVDTIEIDGSDVYVSGNFTDAGGIGEADYIARWDGGSWNVLGNELSGGVNDIEISSGDVYTGGSYFLQLESSEWIFPEGNITNVSFRRASGAGTEGDPYLIGDVYGLQGMGTKNYLDDIYELSGSIDASSTVSWNGGDGFIPIGSTFSPFTGSLDGNGESISGLFINHSNVRDQGLFGKIDGTEGLVIRDVGLVGGSVSSSGYYTGALAGAASNISDEYSSQIINVYSTNDVSGYYYVGGLIGSATNSFITESYSTGDVSGIFSVGGLIGNLNSTMISGSYATGNVSATSSYSGGLFGFGSSSEIIYSYATGDVSGVSTGGGLGGYISNSSVSNSYAYGDVTGSGYNGGGLIGQSGSTDITNVYATGDISGYDYAGGLVGRFLSSTLSNGYATGNVTGDAYIGALIGGNAGTSITNTFALGEATSTGDTPGGLIGKYDSGTLTNNWWYNAINTVDIGDDGNVDDAQIAKASAASDFYGNNQDVYTGWDFELNWDKYVADFPHLIWENFGSPVLSDFIWVYAGAGNSSWSLGSNWFGGAAPGAGDTAIFRGEYDGNALIDTDISIGSLKIAFGYGGVITQSADVFITQDYIQSGASFTAIDPLNDVFSVGNDFQMLNDSSETFDRFTGVGTMGDPYVVYDAYGLQAIIQDLDGYYLLNNDIDASMTSAWNAGEGFYPIGDGLQNPFTGVFDGQDNIITGLTINAPTDSYQGVFGYANGATLQNVGFLSGSIDAGANNYVGYLAGYLKSSVVSNVFVSGDVESSGILVGGLIGFVSQSTVSEAYATGDVAGNGYVGGLFGYNYSSTIRDSYAAGDVTGGAYVGGLVGRNYNSSSILNSYATGNVTGENYVGGLVARNDLTSTIDNSYAAGAVTGDTFVGGLAGFNDYEVTNSFATGVATSSGDTPGGLIGDDGGGTYTNNWWYNATNSVDIGDIGNVDDAQIAKASAVSDFYNPEHAVYDIGDTASGGDNNVEWDIFTPVWDTFEDALPRLSWEGVSGARIFWSGLTDTSWNDAGNWSSGAIPTSSDDVYILDRANDPLNVAAANVRDVNILSSGNLTLGNTLYVAGDYTQSGGTLSAGGNTINVSGNWTVSGGTFTHGNNTVNFNGGNQTITGDNTFYNLTKVASGSETLTFDSASTQTVEGLLKLKGQNRASPMTLQSNSSGDQWSFSAARKSLSFLRVKDSFHAGSSLVYCLNGCIDLGNNTNWLFAFFEENVDEEISSLKIEESLGFKEDVIMKAAADDIFLDRLVFYGCDDLFGAGSEGCTPWNDSLLMLPSGSVKRMTIFNMFDF